MNIHLPINALATALRTGVGVGVIQIFTSNLLVFGENNVCGVILKLYPQRAS